MKSDIIQIKREDWENLRSYKNASIKNEYLKKVELREKAEKRKKKQSH